MVMLAAFFSLPEGNNAAAIPAGRRSSIVDMNVNARDVSPSFKPFNGKVAAGQHNVAFPVANPIIDSRSAAIQLSSSPPSSSSSGSMEDDEDSSDSGATPHPSHSYKASLDDEEEDSSASAIADADPGMDWVSNWSQMVWKLVEHLVTVCHRANLFASLHHCLLSPRSSVTPTMPTPSLLKPTRNLWTP